MKSIRVLCCLLAAFLLSFTTATALADDDNSDRKGRLKGSIIVKGALAGVATWSLDTDCPEFFRTIPVAEGELTHLGWMQYESDHCTAFTADGKGKLIHADGDELWFSYYTPTVSFYTPPAVGPGDPPPDLIVQQGNFFVVGGTGKFRKANGTLLGTVSVVFMGEQGDPGPQDDVWPIMIELSGVLTFKRRNDD